MISFVVVDGSGTILKSGQAGREADALLQADGETVYLLDGHDGGYIDDVNVQVTDGEFAPVGGYAGDLPTVTQLTLPE